MRGGRRSTEGGAQEIGTVMLKCTCDMNEVDAYVEHGVHGYVPMAADDWSGARYGGRPSAAESN